MTAGDPRNWMWGEACAMIERAEQLHRQFFQPDLSSLQAVNWEPPVDIFETARELLIVAALPGVEPQDLDVSIEGSLLIVAGQRRLPAARGATIHRLEIPHGRFERRIRLPAERLRLDRSELASGCLFLRLSKLS
jgi:HSP20 family protein